MINMVTDENSLILLKEVFITPSKVLIRYILILIKSKCLN